jgi:hypothetical protein
MAKPKTHAKAPAIVIERRERIGEVGISFSGEQSPLEVAFNIVAQHIRDEAGTDNDVIEFEYAGRQFVIGSTDAQPKMSEGEMKDYLTDQGYEFSYVPEHADHH